MSPVTMITPLMLAVTARSPLIGVLGIAFLMCLTLAPSLAGLIVSKIQARNAFHRSNVDRGADDFLAAPDKPWHRISGESAFYDNPLESYTLPQKMEPEVEVHHVLARMRTDGRISSDFARMRLLAEWRPWGYETA